MRNCVTVLLSVVYVCTCTYVTSRSYSTCSNKSVYLCSVSSHCHEMSMYYYRESSIYSVCVPLWSICQPLFGCLHITVG